MAKVRVPKYERPPTRFGQIWDRHYGMNFKVSGQYRASKDGEYYWSPGLQAPVRHYSGSSVPRVILVPVEGV